MEFQTSNNTRLVDEIDWEQFLNYDEEEEVAKVVEWLEDNMELRREIILKSDGGAYFDETFKTFEELYDATDTTADDWDYDAWDYSDEHIYCHHCRNTFNYPSSYASHGIEICAQEGITKQAKTLEVSDFMGVIRSYILKDNEDLLMYLVRFVVLEDNRAEAFYRYLRDVGILPLDVYSKYTELRDVGVEDW